MRALLAAGRSLWAFLRLWSGDADYDVYRARVHGPGLSREEFWLESLERRYDRVSRCC